MLWLAVPLCLFPLIMGLGYIYIGKGFRFAVVYPHLRFGPMNALGPCEYNVCLLPMPWIFTLFEARSYAMTHNAQIGVAHYIDDDLGQPTLPILSLSGQRLGGRKG